jgi:radical SAM-linked protein
MIKRLRLQFARGDSLKFLSHLDMMRLWPRLFRRARIDMTYSEGFNAHPRLAVAAPLAVGWTGEAELMEVWLDDPPPVSTVLARLSPVLPEGLSIVMGLAMPLEDPSLQSLMRFAEYEVGLKLDRSAVEVEKAVENLWGMSTLDWSHTRDEETRRYDLRAQVDHIAIHAVDTGTVTLSMRLKNAPSGSGRPEQVALALGFAEHPLSIHRTRLVLA